MTNVFTSSSSGLQTFSQRQCANVLCNGFQLMKLVDEPQQNGSPVVNGQPEVPVTNGDTNHVHSEEEDSQQWTVRKLLVFK